ncbi:MAG: hypothetical protein Q4F72_09850 [Desulfovibrionaceae bacterium]|nr:hypothetical protein [Desulfovibrionaceae bacterium]
MIVYLLVVAIVLLIAALALLIRNVSRLEGGKREVVQLYESFDWNTDAAAFVKKELARLKWSILSWVGALLLMQTVVIFLAIIYIMEASI